ncbi:MAG: hypothetical protein M0Q46_06185 [Endomicrobiales bacterium]|nr:hypothetical protein [Endomicrobiales bacterium]
MKIITDAFLTAQNKKNLKYFYEVLMYRRYWDAGTSTYIWETTGTDIKPYIKTKSNISWQLDTEGLNIWRVSNVQLELKNDAGQFNEGNGKFFNTIYLRFNTKIEIKIGYVLADGTPEDVYSFTGLINEDITSNFSTKTVNINLSGKEIQLSLANAENVCQTVTGETIGTGALITEFYTGKKNTLSVQNVYKNGVLQTLATHYTVSNLYHAYYGALITFLTAPVAGDIITCDYIHGNSQIVEGEQIGTGALNAEFFTDYKGVGFIDAVYIDGEEILVDIDYTVSNLNDKDNFAKITLPLGCAIGQVITCDYRHWYKNIEFSILIGYLLDEAGFLSADRTIGTIDLGNFLKYKFWNTKLDFETMDTVSRNADVETKLGSVLVKVENLISDVSVNNNLTITGTFPLQTIEPTNYTYDNIYNATALPQNSTPVWSKSTSGAGTIIEEINPSGNLHINISGVATSISYSKIAGLHNVDLALKINNESDGYFEIFVEWTHGEGHFVRIQRIDGKIIISGDGLNYEYTAADVNDFHNYQMFYGVNNVLYIFIDNHLIGKIDSTPIAIANNIKFTNATNGTTSEFYLGTLRDTWYYAIFGQLVSNSIDLGVNFSIANFGKIFFPVSVNGDSIALITQTSGNSDFSNDNDNWKIATINGDIATINSSTVAKRYVRWSIIASSYGYCILSMPAHLVDVVDCGTNLDVYNTFTKLEIVNDGEIKVYSQSSADDINYDAELEVVAGIIASTVKRYIRFRTVLSLLTDGTSPELQKETFTYKIDTLNIALADFTGQTVQSVIEEYAKLINYELGVDATGKYFFRARNVDTTIDMELSSKTNIISIDNDISGWARIYNFIKVVIGKFISILSPTTEGETLPHSITKYGSRELSIENSSIGIDDDLDLTSGLATIYYDEYKNPKRELRILCKMLPQLELSDTVNINCNVYWYWGDSRVWWGKPDIFWYNKNMIPVADLLASVVGLELDITDWKLYIIAREI